MPVALPQLPGKSVVQMYKLIREHRVKHLENVFTDYLLLAICWEETKFNNVFQGGSGGTGIGFGQVEPANFYMLESDMARQRGYYVPGLPERTQTKNGKGKVIKTASSRMLSERESIQTQSALLCHLYHSSKTPTKRGALSAYAGVGFSKTGGTDNLGDNKRRHIVDGWLACEHMLAENWDYPADPVDIANALRKSRAFPSRKLDPRYEDTLFPPEDKGWWTP